MRTGASSRRPSSPSPTRRRPRPTSHGARTAETPRCSSAGSHATSRTTTGPARPQSSARATKTCSGNSRPGPDALDAVAALAARRLYGHGLAGARADQRACNRRLERQPARLEVGLGRADERELVLLAGGLVDDDDGRAEA